MSLPLSGVTVLAVEQFGAGPYGSMYLADLGATVIKIENPNQGGDVSRQTGPYFVGDNDSLFFQTFNLNKQSLALDLKNPAGREVFHALVGKCDAVLNNLRGDQPGKLGLDYTTLGQINPAIVCAHLSAYGRDNDRASWPGYDYLMQAEAGFLSLTGEPDGPPARFGLSMVDFMTGAVTALGLLAAYIGALKTGRGRDVDVSLFDVALHQLSYPATWYLNEGHVTTRLARSSHPAAVPCQLYRTADGWVFIMCMIEKFWQTFLAGIERLDLNDNPDFNTLPARREHRDQLTELLDGVLAKQPTQYWLDIFQSKIPIAPVYDIEQALHNPFATQIGMLQQPGHPAAQDLQTLSNPIRLDQARLVGKSCPPLGANGEELINQLGFAEQYAGWRDRGAFGEQ